MVWIREQGWLDVFRLGFTSGQCQNWTWQFHLVFDIYVCIYRIVKIEKQYTLLFTFLRIL